MALYWYTNGFGANDVRFRQRGHSGLFSNYFELYCEFGRQVIANGIGPPAMTWEERTIVTSTRVSFNNFKLKNLTFFSKETERYIYDYHVINHPITIEVDNTSFPISQQLLVSISSSNIENAGNVNNFFSKSQRIYDVLSNYSEKHTSKPLCLNINEHFEFNQNFCFFNIYYYEINRVTNNDIQSVVPAVGQRLNLPAAFDCTDAGKWSMRCKLTVMLEQEKIN